MVKKVLSSYGFRTALVVFGWLSFFVGILIEDPKISIPFSAIARVLP